MSLFRSESIAIALCPGRIGIVEGRNGQAARLHELPAAPGGLPDAAQELSVLDMWLAETKLRSARMRAAVSAHFLRCCLVPWPDQPLNAVQQLAWNRLHFETAYGDMQGWRIVLDPGAYGQSRLACALPADLVAAWHGLCRKHRLRDGRLRPYFVLAWQHWRREVRAGQLWGVAESDRVVWAVHGARGWVSVACAKAQADPELLPVLAARELQLQGGEGVQAVVLHAAEGTSAVAEVDGMPLRWLSAAPPDAPTCVAMAQMAQMAGFR